MFQVWSGGSNRAVVYSACYVCVEQQMPQMVTCDDLLGDEGRGQPENPIAEQTAQGTTVGGVSTQR